MAASAYIGPNLGIMCLDVVAEPRSARQHLVATCTWAPEQTSCASLTIAGYSLRTEIFLHALCEHMRPLGLEKTGPVINTSPTVGGTGLFNDIQYPKPRKRHINDLMQDCSISSALAMEILQFSQVHKPSIWLLTNKVELFIFVYNGYFNETENYQSGQSPRINLPI